MVPAPGGEEGGSDNRHTGADRWLFVPEGTGVAMVNGCKVQLKAGKILLARTATRRATPTVVC
jgi:mannose-6-phosphate isomerase-like protein (cupin superfamily)